MHYFLAKQARNSRSQITRDHVVRSVRKVQGRTGEALAGLPERAHKLWKMALLYENWPLALRDRLHLMTAQPVIYRLRNGVKVAAQARTLDVQVINEIWIDRIYTAPPAFSIRDGWTIVDVGGHKGFFSVLAATSAKAVTVYAFEPSPKSFAYLSHNLELNRLSNVKAFNMAVSQKEGDAIMHLAVEPGCNSLLERSDVAHHSDIIVKTRPLERLLEITGSPVNLMKMDIEGKEFEVLFSCPAECLRRIERIALEYHEDVVRGTFSVSELVRFLNQSGFSTWLRPERRILLAARI